MTQEDKQLLLKDLCTRLPYGVKVHTSLKPICTIFNKPSIYSTVVIDGAGEKVCNISDIKPYLFPLSSMTEEQKDECFNGTPLEIDKYGDIAVKDDSYGNSLYTDLEIYLEVIDWLNKNHFDYRGLIEKDLAIDATNKNVY